MNAMSLDYRTPQGPHADWQTLVAWSLMVGGACGSITIGLWAIYVPRANPELLFPLIGAFGMLIVGVGWWFLNRRGLS
jgi:hypothetical protein